MLMPSVLRAVLVVEHSRVRARSAAHRPGDGAARAERLAAARTADDPWTALLDRVDPLAAPLEALVSALVMDAMIQAYRDPDLEALLSRDNDEERSAIITLRLILRRFLRRT
ncbi:hypothetical protein [Streptomyces sp. CB03238]|uniref:hypothetical protein n=1 Tax=Streptomyces sp. CB03238 TaxID=1907777 RepID=UPI001F4E0560|nr:hypothetical protein [Streptomyces sp. CB03238]